MPQKIIIDTDPGVDDSLAIFFALHSPEIELLGLTTIYGNVEVGIATSNALRLLEIVGRIDIPVATGAAKPLATSYAGPVPEVHGHDGQGNVDLPPPGTQAASVSAAEFTIEKVMAYPREITLVTIGPLTNIALAVALEPEIVHNVKEVVIMGGNALVPGNANPVAEANFLNDPEAGDSVLGESWDVTMVGLDVTHQVNMTREHIASLGEARGVAARHISKILPHYQNFFEERNKIEGIYLHDPTAVAYAIEPGMFETKLWPVRVETCGFSRGKTWPALGDTDDESPGPWRNRPKIRVCVGVAAEKVAQLVVSRLTAT